MLEQPLQMPPGLHQIPTGALKKVWASCVGALHLLWPGECKRQVLWLCWVMLSSSAVRPGTQGAESLLPEILCVL